MRSDTGRSQSTEYSTGEQTTDGQSRGESRSATLRDVHYTLDGERELLINALQRLKDCQCLLSTAALEARLVETPYVPDSFYAYVVENLPEVLLEMQRDRLLWLGERTIRLEPVRLLPAASTVELNQEVIDVEPVEQDGEVVLPRKETDEREVIVLRPVKSDDDPFLD